MKRISLAFCIILLVALSVQMLIKFRVEPYLEALMRDRIHSEMGVSKADEISTDIGISLPKIMTGSIDSLTVEMRGYYTGDLRIDRVYAEAEDIALDIGRLLKGHADIKSIRRSLITAELSEADLNEYLNAKYGTKRILSFRLLDENARIVLNLGGLGEMLDLSVDGDFEVREENSLSFRISDLLINDMGVDLPAEIEEIINGYINLEIGLGELPLGLALKEAETYNGVLRLYGTGSLP